MFRLGQRPSCKKTDIRQLGRRKRISESSRAGWAATAVFATALVTACLLGRCPPEELPEAPAPPSDSNSTGRDDAPLTAAIMRNLQNQQSENTYSEEDLQRLERILESCPSSAEDLVCSRDSNTLGFNPDDIFECSTQVSFSLNPGQDCGLPPDLISDLEQISDPQLILELLRYLDSLDILEQRLDGTLGLRVVRLVGDARISPAPFHDAECVHDLTRVGVFSLLAITRLGEMVLDGAISADDMIYGVPENFLDMAYARFTNIFFSPGSINEGTIRTLDSLNSTVLEQIFFHLSPRVFFNPEYRESVEDALELSVNADVRDMLRRVLDDADCWESGECR